MTDEISSIRDPHRLDSAFNAPQFRLFIDNKIVQEGISRLVTSVTYESADGIADVLKIELVDPTMLQPANFVVDGPTVSHIPGNSSEQGQGGLSDIDLFQPGHEVHVKMGYGPVLDYVGRGVIRRIRKSFPEGGGVPTMIVTAYTLDSIMMDNQPNTSKFKIEPIETIIVGETEDEKKARRKEEAPARKLRRKAEQKAKIRQFPNYLKAIEQKAATYGMTLDVDEDPILLGRKFTHNVTLSDFDLLQCISHVTGYLFWIDATEDGKWILHFRRPDEIRKSNPPFDAPVIEFDYNNGDQGTLLSFDPEWYIQGGLTTLKVIVRDAHAGVKREYEVNVQNNEDAPSYRPTTATSASLLNLIDKEFSEFLPIGELQTAQDIKIVIGEFSWTPVVNRKFKTDKELVEWARQWYRRHRENFILADGTCVGVPRLFARQTHEIKGVGKALSGDYYFTRVAHKCTVEGGYKISFSCRKHPKKFVDE